MKITTKWLLLFSAVLLGGCAALSRWQYIGIYEVDYAKVGIARTQSTFPSIARSVAKKLDVDIEFSKGDPDGYATAFLWPRAGDTRPWPARIVLGESQGKRFDISIIKESGDEPDWIMALRGGIEAGLREGGCPSWEFYIQHGSLYN